MGATTPFALPCYGDDKYGPALESLMLEKKMFTLPPSISYDLITQNQCWHFCTKRTHDVIVYSCMSIMYGVLLRAQKLTLLCPLIIPTSLPLKVFAICPYLQQACSRCTLPRIRTENSMGISSFCSSCSSQRKNMERHAATTYVKVWKSPSQGNKMESQEHISQRRLL